MTDAPGRVDLHRDGDALHVSMAGEVDIAVVEPVIRQLRVLPKVRTAVVDLSAVTYLDTTGIGLLLTVRDLIAPGFVTLRGTTADMERLLTLTGVNSLFDFYRRGPVDDGHGA